MLVPALIVLVAYALGTLPTALLVGRAGGHDPTAEGSGNPGATNVYRTMGRRAGALVLLGDLVKGAAAAGLGLLVGDRTLAAVAGAAAVVGHVLPVGRRGGKGAATYGGAVLAAYPLLGLAAAAGWAAITLLTRRASVASLVLAVGVPVALAVAGTPAKQVVVLAAAGAVVVLRHHDNIARLLRGQERPIEVGDP